MNEYKSIGRDVGVENITEREWRRDE